MWIVLIHVILEWFVTSMEELSVFVATTVALSQRVLPVVNAAEHVAQMRPILTLGM
jgi:hypothetical protein